jgi:hypothetical protein
LSFKLLLALSPVLVGGTLIYLVLSFLYFKSFLNSQYEQSEQESLSALVRSFQSTLDSIKQKVEMIAPLGFDTESDVAAEHFEKFWQYQSDILDAFSIVTFESNEPHFENVSVLHLKQARLQQVSLSLEQKQWYQNELPSLMKDGISFWFQEKVLFKEDQVPAKRITLWVPLRNLENQNVENTYWVRLVFKRDFVKEIFKTHFSDSGVNLILLDADDQLIMLVRENTFLDKTPETVNVKIYEKWLSTLKSQHNEVLLFDCWLEPEELCSSLKYQLKNNWQLILIFPRAKFQSLMHENLKWLLQISLIILCILVLVLFGDMHFAFKPLSV